MWRISRGKTLGLLLLLTCIHGDMVVHEPPPPGDQSFRLSSHSPLRRALLSEQVAEGGPDYFPLLSPEVNCSKLKEPLIPLPRRNRHLNTPIPSMP